LTTTVTDAFSASVAATPESSDRHLRGWARALAVLVLVGTLAVAWHIYRLPGSYSSEVKVVFLAPKSTVNPNALAISSDSIVTTAGAVARIVDPDVEPAVSESVTLAGEGIRHGYSVRLPNSGGQWATNFDKPQLDVQAVGSSAAEVNATMARVLDRIRRTLDRLQTEQHVAQHNMITLSQSPPTVPMYYDHGSRLRAVGATMLLGAGLALGVFWLTPAALGRFARRARTASV
jgi:hypothetical protein